jgi:hypothetical protein
MTVIGVPMLLAPVAGPGDRGEHHLVSSDRKAPPNPALADIAVRVVIPAPGAGGYAGLSPDCPHYPERSVRDE